MEPVGARRQSVATESERERLRGRLAAVVASSQAFARATDLQELGRALYGQVVHVLDATMFMLALYDEPSRTIEVVSQVHHGQELPGGSFPLGSGFNSEVIRTGEPRLIRRWSQEGPRIQVFYATETDRLASPESGLTVPILLGQRVFGVISLQSYAPDAYDEDDLLTMQALAGQVALAIDSLRHSERLDLQLQRRVAELEAILAGITDALVTVDAAGRVVRLNHAARELLRLDTGTHSLVLGQTLDRERWGAWQSGARAVAEVLEPMIEALRRGEPVHELEVEVRSDGRRVLAFSSAPFHDADGQPAGGVVIFRDITGRKEVERLKDEVLSIASHDLKTPITVIKGQAQVLEQRAASGAVPPERLARGLRAIVGQADRMTELLDLLLDLSRLEAGRLGLQPEPMDLAELARTLVHDLQLTTERHRMRVQAPAQVTGTWDRHRLEQVLQNLLANAIKYSPDGGSVTVRIEATSSQVKLLVTDQGVGLPGEEIPHLFERFYRVQGTRSLEGTGLGLYITKGIVAAHGGRIWAESKGPGKGSTFGLELPRFGPGAAAIT